MVSSGLLSITLVFIANLTVLWLLGRALIGAVLARSRPPGTSPPCGLAGGGRTGSRPMPGSRSAPAPAATPGSLNPAANPARARQLVRSAAAELRLSRHRL